MASMKPSGDATAQQGEKQSQSLKASIAEEDRPRERAKKLGFEALTTPELFAIIIGSGSQGESVTELCRRILQDHENKLYNVARNSYTALMKRYRGIGEVKALELLAAIELARRYQSEGFEPSPQITSSDIAYKYLIATTTMRDSDQEEMWVMMLNRSRRVTKCMRVGQGGTNMVIADIKIILRYALEHVADSIILAHNHPSDTLRPSRQDDELTQSVKTGCNAIGIELTDHIIVCRNNYFSYAEHSRL